VIKTNTSNDSSNDDRQLMKYLGDETNTINETNTMNDSNNNTKKLLLPPAIGMEFTAQAIFWRLSHIGSMQLMTSDN
jgi:hypothetical protein